METTVVIGIVDLISKAAKFPQQAMLSYYRASEDMELFQSRLTDLKHQSDHWKTLLRRYNVVTDPEIGSLLEQACQLLDRERSRMEKLRSNCIQRSWKKLSFPEILTDAMGNVIAAFERLPRRLAERRAAREQLESNTFSERAPLLFMPDKKYVELKTTITAVQRALERETTRTTASPVVTLFGGPGQGKTSMARYLALLYQQGSIDININPSAHVEANVQEEALPAQNLIRQRLPYGGFFHCFACGSLEGSSEALVSQDAPLDANPQQNARASARDETVPSKSLFSKRFSDGVFFYSCGPMANSKDLLVELWRDLGYQLLPPAKEADQDQAGSNDPVQESLRFEASLRKELKRRLTNQKVLIILDDVWEPMLIEKLLFEGKWVKYLITTQKPQLWRDKNCEAISIGTPTSEEAYEILRNNVDGFPTDVTPQLEDAIDELIEKSGHNPMVLANVATYIRREHASDLEEWKFAGRNLEKLIHDEDVQLSSVLFGRTYSKRTIQASLTIAMDSLKEKEQTLLFLASIYESQSIPEVVVQIFFKSIYDSLDWFSRCVESLQNSNFIQIKSKITPGRNVPEKSWSIHAMCQEVIKLTKHEKVSSSVAKMLECNMRKEIAPLLLLYGQDKFHCQASNNLTIPRDEWSNNYLQSATLSAIKPFVWMLQADGEGEWQEKSYHLVQQVLQKYLLSGQLDDNSISTLLAMQETISSTLQALEKMASLKDGPIFTKRHPQIIHALLYFIECMMENSHEIAYQSAWLLGRFSFEGLEDPPQLESFPNVIDRLLSLVTKESSPDIQMHATLALTNISYYTVNVIHISTKTAFIATIIRKLVALLDDGVSPATQHSAVVALGNLACDVVQNRITIASSANAIPRLVALLADGVSLDTQRSAAEALGNLACDVVGNSITIASSANAIPRLVALLADGVSPDTQCSAAEAIQNLAWDVVENSIIIASCTNAIPRLVALLADGVSPDTQLSAVQALRNLACDVVENKYTIASSANAIPRLVALLADGVSPNTQCSAAEALGNLACDVVENSITIASFTNAIPRLVALLADGMSPDTQRAAAEAIQNLAWDVVENSITIASSTNAIPRLVALLADGVSPDTQHSAVQALRNLACDVVENRYTIGSSANAIPRLVALLADGVSPDTQCSAAEALGNLACDVVENRITITSSAIAIPRLIALLADGVSLDTQRSAAETLQNLAWDVAENRITISSSANAIPKLVALLDDGMSPNTQHSAAEAVRNLACDVVENDITNAFPRLVALLADGVSLDTQRSTTETLQNLACDVVENRITIT